VIHSSIPDKEKVINDYKNKRDQIGIDYYELGLKAFEREEYSEAYKHFKAADKVGNLQARSFLSAMHYKGVGVPKNLQKAQELIDSGVTKLDIKHKDVDVTQIMTAYNRAINRRYLEYIYSARGDIFKRYFNDEEMALKDMLQIDINKTENPHALNYAAWIMATSKNTKLRDGEKAVRYAKKAVELDGNKSAFIVDTLAAAYADNGQFGKAVETQKKAIKLFKAEKADADVIKDVEQRIRLFESGKAYRE
jgi:tetratricopeptide (TPR) repeat protein